MDLKKMAIHADGIKHANEVREQANHERRINEMIESCANQARRNLNRAIEQEANCGHRDGEAECRMEVPLFSPRYLDAIFQRIVEMTKSYSCDDVQLKLSYRPYHRYNDCCDARVGVEQVTFVIGMTLEFSY